MADDIFISDIEKIKDIIQDSNLNFLIGSGTSVPFFGTLGNVETWLTELEKIAVDEPIKNYVRNSIYKAYCDIAMSDNHMIKDYQLPNMNYAADNSTIENKLQNTFVSYIKFLKLINELIYERRSNNVTKQVNLFTTNIDIFLEKSIEELGLQFNDGFYGIFRRKFSLSNYKKSYFQKSLHYDNISELPVFNLLKVHGSITWKMANENIVYDDLALLQKVTDSAKGIVFIDVKALNNKSWTDDKRDITIAEICATVDTTKPIPDCKVFQDEYEKLQIVNPNKEKFKDTTFNKNYYEMLRMYSNELEKEATAIFVLGFSMADEHIREITIRAIKSNPTLFVCICSYQKEAKDIIENFKKDEFELEKHRNIRLINLEDRFDLQKVNEQLFSAVLNKIISPTPVK